MNKSDVFNDLLQENFTGKKQTFFIEFYEKGIIPFLLRPEGWEKIPWEIANNFLVRQFVEENLVLKINHINPEDCLYLCGSESVYFALENKKRTFAASLLAKFFEPLIKANLSWAKILSMTWRDVVISLQMYQIFGGRFLTDNEIEKFNQAPKRSCSRIVPKYTLNSSKSSG